MDIRILTELVNQILREINDYFNKQYKTVIYETATHTYVGKASMGANEADSIWSIKRITTSSPYIVEWADGNSDNDNVMSDYLTLNYL